MRLRCAGLPGEHEEAKEPETSAMTMMERNVGSLERSAFFLVHRAGQLAADLYAEEVGTRGLTPRQYVVLAAVARDEGLNQTELVARTGIDRSTLADLVQRLQNKGLLQRRRTKADARANTIRLSAAGRRALEATQPSAASADRKLLSVLPAEQRKEFMESLRRISDALDEHAADNGGANGSPRRSGRRR